jgi:hypothetical protein
MAILLATWTMAEAAVGCAEATPAQQNPAERRQTDAPNAEKLLSTLPSQASTTDTARGGASKYLPSVWCQEIEDAPTRERCWAAFRAGFDYYATGLQRRVQVFGWQYVSTVVIFFLVIALVLLGMYFASVQFRRAIPPWASKRDSDGALGGEVELSTAGVRVRSPVLGVIILALSLGFFYVYLVFVYPIREVF